MPSLILKIDTKVCRQRLITAFCLCIMQERHAARRTVLQPAAQEKRTPVIILLLQQEFFPAENIFLDPSLSIYWQETSIRTGFIPGAAHSMTASPF